jgi:hypothetical protein
VRMDIAARGFAFANVEHRQVTRIAQRVNVELR